MTKYSILDLVRIRENGNAKISLNNARNLARQAEQWGYTRFWMAEHHNMPGIASAATSVAIGHVAEGTEKIRVGAGGIMLPNHSPLVIAEQFGTLDALFPGRIDLGLGRAPGTDQLTLRALRRHPGSADNFPQDVLELQALLGPVQPDQRIRAVPGANSHVPLWILGSSTFGAAMAGEFGLPYAFASHFAPDYLYTALETYRSRFKPSEQQATPYCMMGINIIVAPSDEEAEFLASTQRMSVTNLLRGDRGLSKPPIADINTYWSIDERVQAQRMLAMSVVGSPDTVREKLEGILTQTRVNELMIVSDIYDHSLRLQSYEYIAQIMQALNEKKQVNEA
ncbi:LLM class flavin-dependent oxidoreductase [Neopusillimonas maritima]|jgi:luciferase family oxidoreductase group 1|uniref:Luciferase-like monooxygenase n=1 Tax=Neopusillimonas maritima TaxID=2026239 RepID=A0A3A1YWS0_9BURK|nr:LLM class flavin-dependent oxidoreductase [Neopusillimonas maritima]MAL01083.1 alkane 1-monooxygenase [Alcaligenaceae bacterium]RII82011.1 alkane 1-monooxygenase [Neopusillimonas maritima]RIY40507.1 alkane 1-monooxygenase [Neopusillimonas maritima]|tara:strand:- start:3014 stop:4027 length:1014 start_codon:yes stop_codon:yes gene_type:complete